MSAYSIPKWHYFCIESRYRLMQKEIKSNSCQVNQITSPDLLCKNALMQCSEGRNAMQPKGIECRNAMHSERHIHFVHSCIDNQPTESYFIQRPVAISIARYALIELSSQRRIAWVVTKLYLAWLARSMSAEAQIPAMLLLQCSDAG